MKTETDDFKREAKKHVINAINVLQQINRDRETEQIFQQLLKMERKL